MSSSASVDNPAGHLEWPRLSILLTLLFTTAIVIVRRHVQHPLYKFPGPLLASFSNIAHSYWFMKGRQPFKILELHNKYGPVVRVAPNDLSFNSAASLRDIYSFRQGHKPFVKSGWYDGGVFADQAHSIVSERDPVIHGQMRKFLSHAFSEKSLKDQEPLINEVVDDLVTQLEVHASTEMGVDIVKWYNLTTFDIIGSLAFGESFGGVKSGLTHPWIALVIKAIRQSALADTLSRFPFFAKIFRIAMPKTIEALVEDTKTHEAYTLALIKKRLQSPNARPDFLTRMLENSSVGLSDVQIAAHASDFVIAGSETTATTLSCVTYYLLKNPDIYATATSEVRTKFERYEDINATAASHLKYLHALALEGMRVYPPLPLALPRVVPMGGDTVDGFFVPETVVSTNPLAASLSPDNFNLPLEFRPERWLEEDTRDNLEAAQPFSLGPRGCLGRNLAWIELNLVLCKLLWTYDLQLLSNDVDWLRDSRMAMLWQKPELRVRVKRRKITADV